MLKTMKHLLTLLTVCLGASSVMAQEKSAAKPTVTDAELKNWVEKRVEERQPPAADKRFDDIGWARDIRHALALAKEHQRPVFLFTHDGRMNLGRC
jgi:hypothetical protein